MCAEVCNCFCLCVYVGVWCCVGSLFLFFLPLSLSVGGSIRLCYVHTWVLRFCAWKRGSVRNCLTIWTREAPDARVSRTSTLQSLASAYFTLALPLDALHAARRISRLRDATPPGLRPPVRRHPAASIRGWKTTHSATERRTINTHLRETWFVGLRGALFNGLFTADDSCRV